MLTDYDLRARLHELNLNPRRQGKNWVCKCPCHDDRTPSMSACVSDTGRLLLYCHAGCTFQSLVAAIGVGTIVPSLKPAPSRESQEPDRAMTHSWLEIRRQSSATVDEVSIRERGLGIPMGGLARLGVAWAMATSALAAPMVDRPGGNVIGVRLRSDDGRKWAIQGSKNGLFAPVRFNGEGDLYIPEGFTDTAALCGLGLDAIGRPSCNGGRDLVRAAAKVSGRTCVIVSDRDAPGEAGAALLAKEMAGDGMRVKIIRPPEQFKDVRAWVIGGATRGDIEFLARHRGMWT